MATYKSTVLITGGTSGIGLHAAEKIAKQCPDRQVIVASRSNKDDAANSINAKLKQQNVVYLPLDLSDPENVRLFEQKFRQKTFPPVSALLLNAGLQFPGEIGFTSQGLERTFAINHVGGSLLFFLMMPHLTTNARIVLTSSGVHDPAQKAPMPLPVFKTAEQVARPDPKTAPKNGRVHYTTSKLCNMLWTYALDRRIRQNGKQWTVAAYDPGWIPETGLAREYPAPVRFLAYHIFPHMLPLFRLFMGPNIYRAKESGEFLADIAIDAKLDVGGKYFSEKKAARSSKESYDEAKQEDLWTWTIKEVAKDGEAESFARLG